MAAIQKPSVLLAGGDMKLREILCMKPAGVFLSESERVRQAATFKQRVAQAVKKPEAEISIIQLVDDVMTYAFLARASNVHLEPFEDRFVARMRIDGILNDVFAFSKGLHQGIVARIKTLGDMRTNTYGTDRDARFRMCIAQPKAQFDVRVSIVPTHYGENATLQLFTEQADINSLDDLALFDESRARIRRAAQMPYGMILATGPAGSGTTTTLHAIIKELNGLRQDQNIVVADEIGDEETVPVAVHTALAGNKLLATLNAQDAGAALVRLLDMSVEPFLVASTVNAIIGQRLVRAVCPQCTVPRRISDAELTALKANIPESLLQDQREFFVGTGCAACSHSGYRGRIGVYEVLEMSDPMRKAVMRRADVDEVRRIAVKSGMVTLLEDGFMKAKSGRTTIEEVLRAVHQ